jgi:redox-sensitive bicupin YhaK (pirin superfamily)
VSTDLLVPGIDVKRTGERFATRIDWLDSKHSFSFGQHYDPGNTHFGLLLVSNDDVVAPGTGFETHPHRDMEIVTWVLDGGLVHQDSTGHNGLIYPGLAQRMSAGTGILHSEKNDLAQLTGALARADVPSDRPVHFVQMWVAPDQSRITPGYEQLDITDELGRGGLVPVASGMPRHAGSSAIRIAQKNAALFAARLAPGQSVVVPTAPFVHVYVARGNVSLEGAGALATGDAARITGAEGQRITATDEAEVLLWEMHAGLAFG